MGVRFDRKTGNLFFGSEERRWNDDGVLVLHWTDLAECTVVQLARALEHADLYHGGDGHEIFVSKVEAEQFDEDLAPIQPARLSYEHGIATLVVEIWNDAYEDDEEIPDFEGLLRPIAQRHGLSLTSAKSNPDYGGPAPHLWDLSFDFSQRGRSLRALFEAGEEVVTLLDAASSGRFSRTTLGDLIRSGHPELLVGLAEGHWPEAKRQHYDLQTLSGKVRLAEAAARFCNSEDGGLVVIGAETKDRGSGDVIVRITPMASDARVRRRYQQALHNHLYPPPDGLSLDVVRYADGDLMVIDIPPQPEELKPFLVHGSVVDGRGEGAFISIVRRRGDISIPTTAAMIHSTLAAGRALLRGPLQHSIAKDELHKEKP